ncbi:cobaltochelatase subunit CobN [Hahella sp. KA22]|uniref:cobaltochelatase subunit CobN n=1 Tax=Hahella sp. KA22 TaxID=1628392 RepID=UPI000FDDD63F|nr:cobaltochelatase subunit CobN [Hahella sp. KA22]AZZ94928.1 cobaltochelatase subunit CobN [Hahella sp. KA22]QAY52572.1 cobaltochelatase subunit CobN [Hahella sp. KA22]
MHLLAAQPGGFNDGEGIVDLQQTPADLVILTAADGALALLAQEAETLPDDYPSLRLANWMHLSKPAAFDLYRDQVLDHAKVVVLSLLGGASYWPYGLEQLQDWAQRPGRTLIVVPGDDGEDQQLLNSGNVDVVCARRVWRYLREGGRGNSEQLFRYLATVFFGQELPWLEPKVIPRSLIYHPAIADATLQDWRNEWRADQPTILLLFYRSHLQEANTAMFDGLIRVLQEQGLNPLPLAVASLKETVCLETVDLLCQRSAATVILNTTAFALQSAGNASLSSTPTDYAHPLSVDLPILQVILASSSEADWREQSGGLRSRDIAMHIALPELDGRIITRAVGFKDSDHYSERCQLSVVRYVLQEERARFVAELALRWSRLSAKPNAHKRIALVLANYPTRDGRIGNGVGLDTPRSTLNLLRGMQAAGYPVSDIPENSAALIELLQSSVTNNPDTLELLPCQQSMALADYEASFNRLPERCRQAVLERWGAPQQDPKCRAGRLMLSGVRLGETFVGIQPARGYNMDLAANYHDPDLIPPHSYLAFYFWLRHAYEVDAIVHVGKHGNLEWLPGKGVALSEQCWPDIALGPMPHIYPFIVNDPGEGAQAKRRAQAVIIDHLMPPMTRAEVYGELAELERMVDEYYQAMGLDARRENHLRREILQKARSAHVLTELPQAGADSDDNAVLQELDTYLCDIKEAQIRDGLHCLGELPEPMQMRDTLTALVRLPRGEQPDDRGLLHALAADLQMSVNGDDAFDPLQPQARLWRGARPQPLVALLQSVWRTEQHTRERLELYAQQLVEQYVLSDAPLIELRDSLPSVSALLVYIQTVLKPALQRSADNEIQHSLRALAGRFVPPGPSGAPTRGRLDTLPTGRNFYAVDSRAIPSKTAWELGQASAEQVVLRHLQEHGDYPRQIGLSVWGTATMRTGGDDIAQAFALMGVKPVWAPGSHRVVDFEIIPAFYLNRPRVDVTLRVSGFFRDAFPNVIKLFDAAVQKLAELEEPGDSNLIQRHIREREAQLTAAGATAQEARRQAGFRVFGSKPGAYGAGLQGLIDERCWETPNDLARAYVQWGGYAYGQNEAGEEAFGAFSYRLGQLEVVMQNQDNREHDILDSDDYYQFQGGMTNAVSVLRGDAPSVYLNDHSNPAAPKIRTLKEELNRVIRSRVTNPKWIAAMQRHSYKGAFEMAASVDYLFAYDATTGLVDDYQYANVSDALAFDAANQAFMREHNPQALQEMAERLLEAMQRGLWQEPGNYRERIESLLLELDERAEESF